MIATEISTVKNEFSNIIFLHSLTSPLTLLSRGWHIWKVNSGRWNGSALSQVYLETKGGGLFLVMLLLLTPQDQFHTPCPPNTATFCVNWREKGKGETEEGDIPHPNTCRFYDSVKQ